MEITMLPPGVRAPSDADCIHIEQTQDGRFRINCSALHAAGDSESVALIGGDAYPSYDAAEAAGLAWADAEQVQHIYVSRSEEL